MENSSTCLKACEEYCANSTTCEGCYIELSQYNQWNAIQSVNSQTDMKDQINVSISEKPGTIVISYDVPYIYF